MGGRIVSLAIFPGRELVLMLLGEYLPNAPSLTLGARLSTSYPLRPVGGGATPKAPLSLLGSSRGVWLCVNPRDLRSEEWETFDINAFKKFQNFVVPDD